MTKNEFYEQLHEKLGKAFGISPYAVEVIRSSVLGPRKLSRAQIILWAKEKLEAVGVTKRMESRKVHDCSHCKHIVKEEIKVVVASNKRFGYMEIINFVQKSTEEQWKDIIFDYQYADVSDRKAII